MHGSVLLAVHRGDAGKRRSEHGDEPFGVPVRDDEKGVGGGGARKREELRAMLKLGESTREERFLTPRTPFRMTGFGGAFVVSKRQRRKAAATGTSLGRGQDARIPHAKTACGAPGTRRLELEVDWLC